MNDGETREKNNKETKRGGVQLDFPHILDGADYNHPKTSFPPYEFILSFGGGGLCQTFQTATGDGGHSCTQLSRSILL